MHSAGIKRVFWTNTQGEWEGGKVRDLLDDLDGPSPNEDYGNREHSGKASVSSVFVTKAEVLMLKGLND